MADRNAAWAVYRIVLTGGVPALLMVGTLAFLYLAATGPRDAGTAALHSKAAFVATEWMARFGVDRGEGSRGRILTRDPGFQRAAGSDSTSARTTVENGHGPPRPVSSLALSGRRAVDATRELTVVAVIFGVAVLVLIVLFAGRLAKGNAGPVWRVVAVARRPAGGGSIAWRPGPSAGAIGWRFTAMAVWPVTSRDALRRVASEQGALRRVATLVARGVSPAEVFDAVAAEVGHILAADHTAIIRFEADDTAQVVGYWNDSRVPKVMPPLGGRWPIETGSVTATLRATGRPTRMKHGERATSVIGAWAHAAGVNCAVGCPVTVEGRAWGGMIMHWLRDEPPAGVTEARMREFVELVGTAIANAQSRSELLASRARVVAAADESRRRIERELHDGAQQRLVTLALKLRTVEVTLVPPGGQRLRDELCGLVNDLAGILRDVQGVSRGIIPPVLARSGLGPALRSLARHASVPVTLAADDVGRLPEPVEVAVYSTVAEALKNVDKHALASEARVGLVLEHRRVRLSVQDDGRGGATMAGGSGLVGLKDRVEALGGTIEVVSPSGAGTAVLVEVPVEPSGAGLAP